MKEKIMEGTIEFSNNEWIINYFYNKDNKQEYRFLSLHPDDVNMINEWNQIFDNVVARITNNPNVKFKIINNYAKLIR